jgi:hypothetical protein
MDFVGSLFRIIIIPINTTVFRKNTAHGATTATIKPPIVGPATRLMLPPKALRVSAAGSSDLGTRPLNVGIIGVLIIVIPAPRAKVSVKSIAGVIIPIRESIPSIMDIATIYAHVIRSRIRRSKMSDNIPDGNANKKIGKAVAVVMRETNNGSDAMEVINHEAPTSYIDIPTYEKRAAIHNVLNIGDLKGFSPDMDILSCLSPSFHLSTIENN